MDLGGRRDAAEVDGGVMSDAPDEDVCGHWAPCDCAREAV